MVAPNNLIVLGGYAKRSTKTPSGLSETVRSQVLISCLALAGCVLSLKEVKKCNQQKGVQTDKKVLRDEFNFSKGISESGAKLLLYSSVRSVISARTTRERAS